MRLSRIRIEFACDLPTEMNKPRWYLLNTWLPSSWCNVYTSNDGRFISTLSIVYLPRFGFCIKISTDFIFHATQRPDSQSPTRAAAASTTKTLLNALPLLVNVVGHVRFQTRLSLSFSLFMSVSCAQCAKERLRCGITTSLAVDANNEMHVIFNINWRCFAWRTAVDDDDDDDDAMAAFNITTIWYYVVVVTFFYRHSSLILLFFLQF